jgi:hypothetical protein
MDEANQQLARVVRAIYVLAALELVVFVAEVILFDEEIAAILNPALTSVIAVFLQRRRSRTLAVTLFLLGAYGAVRLALQTVGIMEPDDSNTPMWMGVVDDVATIALGVLAASACFRWHIAARTAIMWKSVVVVSLLTAVYSSVGLLAGVVASVIVLGDQDSPLATLALVFLWIGLIVAGFAGAFPGTRRRPWAVP